MSTIVYQGILQSCFESQIIETTTLKLKIPSSIEKCNTQITNKPSSTSMAGGWSFLQNLSNISSKDSNFDQESGIYVHPLSKKSSYSSRLSEKSLQLCTESLGSETGTDIIDTTIFSSSSSSSSYSPTIEKKSAEHVMTQQAESSSTWQRNCNNKVNKKKCCSSKFPPPLTTIRGLNSMQIKPHREDGRLIIKAVEAPLKHNYLQAERSNGRLRLCFFKHQISEENQELEETENDVVKSDIIDDDVEEEMEEEKEEEDTEEEEEESDDVYIMKWDTDGNKFEVEGEMGKEKCQRLSRCKESGKGNKVFGDWRKPLWVATS